MRKLAAAGLLIMSLPATGLADEIPFFGVLQYTNALNCLHQTAGNHYRSVYKPSNIGDNGSDTFINGQFDFGGHGYRLTDARFTSAFQTVDGFAAAFQGQRYEARIRVTESMPPDSEITAKTPYVWLIGQIEGPEDDPGLDGYPCVMSFRAAYARLNRD